MLGSPQILLEVSESASSREARLAAGFREPYPDVWVGS